MQCNVVSSKTIALSAHHLNCSTEMKINAKKINSSKKKVRKPGRKDLTRKNPEQSKTYGKIHSFSTVIKMMNLSALAQQPTTLTITRHSPTHIEIHLHTKYSVISPPTLLPSNPLQNEKITPLK